MIEQTWALDADHFRVDHIWRAMWDAAPAPAAEPPQDVDGLIAEARQAAHQLRDSHSTLSAFVGKLAAALAAMAKERDDLLNAAGSVVGSLTDDAYEAIKAAEQRAEQAEREREEAREEIKQMQSAGYALKQAILRDKCS